MNTFTQEVTSKTDSTGYAEAVRISGAEISIAFKRQGGGRVWIEIYKKGKLLAHVETTQELVKQLSTLLEVFSNNIDVERRQFQGQREHNLRMKTIGKWSPKG